LGLAVAMKRTYSALQWGAELTTRIAGPLATMLVKVDCELATWGFS